MPMPVTTRKTKKCLKASVVFFTLLVSGITNSWCQDLSEELKERYLAASEKYRSYEQAHRRNLPVQNVTLSYLEWGDAGITDRVLIWLHGSLSNAYEFMPFAATLVEQGYRIIAVDQYNHGQTPLPSFDASFVDFSADLKMLLDHLGIKKAVIGGFSRGAYMATSFYHTYPEHVKALVLEDGGSVDFHNHYFKLDSLALCQKLQEVNMPVEIFEQYMGYFPSELAAFKSLYDPTNDRDQFEVFSFIKHDQGRWKTYRGLSEYYHMQDSLHMAQVLFHPEMVSRYAASIVLLRPFDILRNAKIPILVLEANGIDDQIPVSTENHILARENALFITHRIFADAQHNIHYTCPEEFLSYLQDFLNRIAE
jgi:pimeloyl-ACP methyl ester carboxylesterase